jgi:hypothetical protein
VITRGGSSSERPSRPCATALRRAARIWIRI